MLQTMVDSQHQIKDSTKYEKNMIHQLENN